jgi:hypothetical protein
MLAVGFHSSSNTYYSTSHISLIRKDTVTRRNNHNLVQIMKYNTVVLAFLLVYRVVAQPHPKHKKKQDIVCVLVDGTTTTPTFSTTQSLLALSKSVYVLPLATASSYVAIAFNTVTTPEYPLPTTTAALVQVATAPSLSPSSGPCTAKSPCLGDLTYYTTSLSAYGITNNSNSKLVVALLHDL